MTDDLKTDVDRANAFLSTYGEDIRYSPDLGSWFLWDGRRWELDRLNKIASAARQSGLSSSDRGQDAFVRQASKERAVRVPGEQWDGNAWVLACPNVVVDLKTGAVRAGERSDLNTKLAGVECDRAATAPGWERFLEQVLPDKHMRGFVQRFMGYCLTGSVTEQVFAFFYGDGANGKSTLIKAVQGVMGEYAGVADEHMLLARRGEPHPTELTDLHGRRLVVASEIPAGRTLNVARVKQLTGGDTIRARFLYQQPFSFNPTHKLLAHGNSKPMMGDPSSAIWRRLLPVPFGVKIAEHERDRDIDEKLAAEGPGILNWLIDGCLSWQEGGLRVPPELAREVEQYRQEDDAHADFFDQELVMDSDGWTASGALNAAYRDWAKRNVGYELNPHDVADRLRKKGARHVRRGPAGSRGWAGVRIEGSSARFEG